ncbi:hypothetical protein KY362_01845 [Candidatus Woesearchaeota archaeon]|nr:hypothetical protein [Candidatus Woesearchaeota archaeon]
MDEDEMRDEYGIYGAEFNRLCTEPFETAPRRYELSYRVTDITLFGSEYSINCDVYVLTDDRRWIRGSLGFGWFSEDVPPLHKVEHRRLGPRVQEGVRRVRFGGWSYEGPEVDTLAQKVAQKYPIREGDQVRRILKDDKGDDEFTQVYVKRDFAPSESLFRELLEKYSKE